MIINPYSFQIKNQVFSQSYSTTEFQTMFSTCCIKNIIIELEMQLNLSLKSKRIQGDVKKIEKQRGNRFACLNYEKVFY